MPTTYDAELRRHNEVLRSATGVRPGDRVLDIGCGSGQTTRDAARAARDGSALGVDISAAAVERARDIARDEGLGNVTFEVANAEDHGFPAEHFDLAISRFGTMFFADAVAAFVNIRAALRPGGRLVMMVWQARELNEWTVVINGAVAGADAPAPARLDAFSLGDPATVERILGDAGFTDVALTDVREPVYYGPDADTAVDWILGFATVSDTLKNLAPDAAARALDRLRQTLSAHQTDDGVWFGSRAWIVTAHR